jgi:hypothetical protein
MKKMNSFSTAVPRTGGSGISQFNLPGLCNYKGIMPAIILILL